MREAPSKLSRTARWSDTIRDLGWQPGRSSSDHTGESYMIPRRVTLRYNVVFCSERRWPPFVIASDPTLAIMNSDFRLRWSACLKNDNRVSNTPCIRSESYARLFFAAQTYGWGIFFPFHGVRGKRTQKVFSLFRATSAPTVHQMTSRKNTETSSAR